MARSWIVDCKGIATKVKNAGLSPALQIKDCGAHLQCPNCYNRIDNSDVSPEWPGFPAGVKFDPSDAELLDHLAAKCGIGNSNPHLFIDEFISTVDKGEGICYTHPENLPGVKKDGSTVHFFHKTTNAYASGQRKRRKINNQDSVMKEDVRWHKTGKTKPVTESGVHKGFKKIMVLYKITQKGTKPGKSNWVMHQYHLGTDEDEIEGQYVVSKIFYQLTKQHDTKDGFHDVEDCELQGKGTSPQTPNTVIPNPPRSGKSLGGDDVLDDSVYDLSSVQEPDCAADNSCLKSETEVDNWLAGESQTGDDKGIEDLLCTEEMIDLYRAPNTVLNYGPFNDFGRQTNDVPEMDRNQPGAFADLENLELDPPDFQLADLQFCSQDSLFGWLDRL